MRALGLTVEVVPERYVGEALAAALTDRVRGQRVLLVRAAVARDVVPDALTAAGATVTVVDAYRTVVPADAVERAQAIFGDESLPDAVVFTSGSTVMHLLDVLRDAGLAFPRRSRCVSIGPVTSAAELVALRRGAALDGCCVRECGDGLRCGTAGLRSDASLDALCSAALVARPGLVAGVALFLDGAVDAAGFAGDADGAAVQDELVAEVDPVIFRDDLHQILLDFFRLGVEGELEAAREAQHVGVDDDAFGDAGRPPPGRRCRSCARRRGA